MTFADERGELWKLEGDASVYLAEPLQAVGVDTCICLGESIVTLGPYLLGK